MSPFLAVFIAVLLDRLIGEPTCWHPLVGFGNLAQQIERHLNRQQNSQLKGRFFGTLALSILIIPTAFIAYYLSGLGLFGIIFEIILLFLAIGARSLHEHAIRIYQALTQNDLIQARKNVGMIVSRDTEHLAPSDISTGTVESVLENGCDAIFAALFWFLIAGAPGVVVYRLSNTLDAMWGYKTDRYVHFGWAAARLDDGLNYLPARLTALTYALMGNFSNALQCWLNQGHLWKSPNAGPVMSAGAGALSLQLGGKARYHGKLQSRPVLGKGKAASTHDIKRATDLINRSLLFWIILCLIIWGISHIA